MLGLLLSFSLAHLHHIKLPGRSHDVFQLNPMDEVEILVTSYPVVVVLPRLSSFTATVYTQLNNTNIVSGTLAPGNGAFGAYFRRPGRIFGSATKSTQFEYYSLNSSRPCPIFSISSYPFETFAAHKDDSRVNLTIKNSQRYCLFHISDAPSDISVNFSTEDGYDILYFENGGSEQILTGDGLFRSVSPTHSRLSWVSDASTLSTYFSVMISSPTSSLPSLHLNYTATSWPETAVSPEILYDRAAIGFINPTANPYANADADWYRRTGNQATVDAFLIVVAVFFWLVLVILAVCLAIRCCRRLTLNGNDSQMEMLNLSDMAGVRKIALSDSVGKAETEENPIEVSLSITSEDSHIEVV
jgi:hypothetical protein